MNMIKTTYSEYLVNTINHIMETYNDKKREERLKSMIVEINSTDDEEKLGHIAEQLDYLINVIKQSSIQRIFFFLIKNLLKNV